MRKLIVAASLLALLNSCRSDATASRPGDVLTAIDSTAVSENDSHFVGTAVDIVSDAHGTVFVSDAAQKRVVAIGRNGNIARVFGRQGRGPGEFVSPSFLALGGDTLLYVRDAGQKVVHVFDTRSGAILTSKPLPASSGRIRVVNGALVVAAFNPDSQTSVAKLAANQAATLMGTLPPLALQHPPLLGPFAAQAFTFVGDTLYSLNELSNDLQVWSEGSGSISQWELPRKLRRGVSSEDYVQMLNDPAKAADIAFRHSIPMMLEHSASGMLVAALYDVERVGNAFSGKFYLTLIDVARQRACVDIAVPAPEDPPARLTMHGDTLVSIQQAPSATGASVTSIKRFLVNADACNWTPLASRN